MLPLRVARSWTRPGRLSQLTSRFYSTKTASTKNATTKYYIATSVASISGGLLWITNTRSGDNKEGDDVPRLKITPPAVVKPGLGEDEVTRILSQGAYSFPVRNVAGVSRYDGTQLASNSPCEDRFVHGKFDSPWNDTSPSQWMAWAVLDGHAGWQTADLLQDDLLPSVQHSLSQLKPASSTEGGGIVPDKLVQAAITRAFVDLDDSIVKSALDVTQDKELSLPEKVRKLAPAYAGSCVLLSLYDPATSTLHVACTGDSRAVLGQRGSDGKWEALPLSVDQTGSNADEIARIYGEHPGEEEIVKNGRVLGLMVSRAFGDSRWKWPLEFQQDMKRRFYGPNPLTPRYNVQTPPYITAEPVVTSTKIDPAKPSFLILATDGLWDMLSSQQGVDLVGKWLESQQTGEKKANYEPEPVYSYDDRFDFGQLWKKEGGGHEERFVESRTTTRDDNVAVHLVRNALGGNHHEMIAGRLAFSSPFSRSVRDDITVQVVFFGPALKNE